MSFFRFFLLGLFFVLAYRLVRDVARSVLSYLHTGGSSARKKSTLDLDESQIQDAEFQDIDP